MVERRNWLENHEKGRALDEIAREARRDQRTVKTNVERARLERDFEAVEREQLREALRSHQADMLAQLERFMHAVQMPDLTFRPVTSPDFGLESLLSPKELLSNSQVSLGPTLSLPAGSSGIQLLDSSRQGEMLSAITVLRDGTGPTGVLLAGEDSTLWRAVKEHIGSRDPLWRNISHWKQALLNDCQGIASLNRAIKNRAEESFGMLVLWGSGHQAPYLAAPLVGWARAAAVRVADGEPVPEVTKEVREVEAGRLESLNGLLIAVGIQADGEWEQRLQKTVEGLIGLDEVGSAARTGKILQDKRTNVYQSLEEYLLVHHLPGRCSLCRKLGG